MKKLQQWFLTSVLSVLITHSFAYENGKSFNQLPHYSMEKFANATSFPDKIIPRLARTP